MIFEGSSGYYSILYLGKIQMASLPQKIFYPTLVFSEMLRINSAPPKTEFQQSHTISLCLLEQMWPDLWTWLGHLKSQGFSFNLCDMKHGRKFRVSYKMSIRLIFCRSGRVTFSLWLCSFINQGWVLSLKREVLA